MKKQVGIWLDTEKAVLVSLLNGKQDEIQTIHSEVESRKRNPGEVNPNAGTRTVLSSQEKKMTNRKKQQMHHYFEKILHSITQDTEEIYIFGPAEAKNQFEKELKKQAHLATRHLSLDGAEKMSTAQMIAQVKKHFGQHGTHKQ